MEDIPISTYIIAIIMYKSIKLHLFFLQIWSSLIRLLQGVVRRRPSQFITDDCLYELKVKGFVPVIAHIERYFHSGLDYSIIDNWIDMGCVLQINRTSILGMHGKTIQSNALSLLDDGYCDVIGTDTHRASGHRISKLSDAYSVVSKRIGSYNADILFFENPKRILSDMDILNIEVVKKKKRFSFFRR